MRALVAKERKPKRRAEREAPSIAIILLRSTEKQLYFQSQTRADLPPPPPPLTWPPPPRRHDREQLPPKELKERENIPMVCKKTVRAPLKLGGSVAEPTGSFSCNLFFRWGVLEFPKLEWRWLPISRSSSIGKTQHKNRSHVNTCVKLSGVRHSFQIIQTDNAYQCAPPPPSSRTRWPPPRVVFRSLPRLISLLLMPPPPFLMGVCGDQWH